MTIASLAMYPFTNLRTAYDQLWAGVRSHLPHETPELDWELEHDAACRRDDLLVGQTCGWPLVNEFAGKVRVLGTFDCAVEGALDGTYCSVLVSGLDESLAGILRRADLRVAANSSDSLSGWISLQSVAAAQRTPLDSVEWTGSHARSIEAVSSGRCHLAAIDAVSWGHLGGPALSVVGSGPRIPCLPLVTSRSSSTAMVDDLRGALDAAVSDPALAEVCETLKIRGFVERDMADYEGVSGLLELG